MASEARKPMPNHMFFPSSGYRNPLPFLETYEPGSWQKIIPRMSDDSGDIKEGIYLGLERNVDVVELLKGPNRDFLIKKKKGETKTVCVPIEQELKGCYVIVACFLAPILSAFSDSDPCHALIHLFEEVSPRRLDPECKIVIVAKVRQCAGEIWMDKNVEQVAFDHFLSGFPDGFLAIPFSDHESRDRVFSSLSKTKQPRNAALIVDPDGKVLDFDFGDLCSYGAAFYPFSLDHVDRLSRGDERLRMGLNPFPYQDSSSLDYKSPLMSLAQLFNRSPEDVLLAKIRGDGMVNPAPLSTLMNDQLVALYLCGDGRSMDGLVKIYLQCRECVPKLEVVVVPLAFSDYPPSYYDHIVLALAERNITTWWALHPYNDKITRTLFRLSGGRDVGDRLILVPAVGEGYSYCGDVNAHAVLSLMGLYPRANKALPPSMYPFTTEKLYLERLSSLRQVTLPSLLRRFKPDLSPEDLQQLQGKNVLLCLDRFFEDYGFFYKLSNKCPEILEKYDGCKWIGVTSREDPGDVVVSMIPWMFLLSGAFDSISKALYFEDLGEYRRTDFVLFAFGGDGRILSRHATKSLANTDNLFDDVLSQEIYEQVIDDVETEVDCMP